MPVKRILVVRLGAMGDVVHALPAVVSLRRGFPEAEIVWVIHPRWLPLLAGNRAVDRTIPFDRRDRASIPAVLGEMRRFKADLAVDFQGLLQSAVLARVSGAAERVGFARGYAREKAAALLYSEPVRPVAAHVVERNLELAAVAGGAAGPVEFPLPEGEEEGDLGKGRFVLACPLAGWESKQWPLAYYSSLAGRLAVEGLRLVVNGAPASREQLQTIEGAEVHTSGISGLIHATRRAAAVVGVDSGPLHVAAALGKRGVAIYGPTDPQRNGPYGESIQVLRQTGAVTSYKRRTEIDPSMAAIGADEVFAVLRPLL